MTTLYLIRHAITEMNANGAHLIGGRSPHTPLTHEGEDQARKLGKRFLKEKKRFGQWFSGRDRRHVQTVTITSDICQAGAEITVDERLCELGQGEWEGRLRSEIYTPECLARMAREGGNFKAPGGESQFEKEAQFMAFAEECRQNFPDQEIGVVTSGIVIKCGLRGIQNWDQASTYLTEIDNTSITIVHYHNDRQKWGLRRMNDVAHLTLL